MSGSATAQERAAPKTRLVDPNETSIEGRARDLAMLAIDSKPRGCDVVAIRV
jgi:hypothetical protein